jgi:hypothetical protein
MFLKSKVRILSVVITFSLLVVGILFFSFFGPSAKSSQGQAQAAENCQTFKETGFSVCGRFLDYWLTHGGLAQQGFPISGVFNERNAQPPAGDGQVHRVQYFQRARFEEHNENQAPYDVLLGLLGSEQYSSKYGTPAAQGTPFLAINSKRTQSTIDNATPRSGYTYLILDFTMTNNLGVQVTANPASFVVVSDQNFSYDYSSDSYYLPKELKLTKLAPNAVTRGELAFEVPTNEVIKSFVFDDYTNKVTIPIN